MNPAWSFQTLPNTVTSLILNQLCKPHFSKHKDQKHVSIPVLLLPLSHVCSNWRAAVLYILYSKINYDVLTDIPRVPSAKDDVYLPPAEYAQPYLPYVQQVVIGGISTRRLSSASLWLTEVSKDWQFVTAKSVVLDVFIQQLLPNDTGDDDADIRQMVTAVKQMLPQLNKVVVFITTFVDSDEPAWRTWCKLVDKLFGTVENTVLHVKSPCLPPQTGASRFSTQLSTLLCHWNEHTKHTIQLLQANAASLETLTITFYNVDGLNDLFVTENGCPVTFPHLHNLTLLSLDDSNMTPIAPIDNSVVPFPTLRYLRVLMKYPFSDDLLFRGNYKALVQLQLIITNSTIAVLNQHGMFSALTTRKLESLVLLGMVNSSDDLQSSKPVLSRLLASSQSIKRLVITDFELAELFISITRETPTICNLASISIQMTNLTLLSAVTLLKHVPTLQSLTSQIAGIGTEFEFTDIIDLLHQIQTKYPLSGSQLCSWNICNAELPINHTIACILCIADGCAHLGRVVFSKLDCEEAECMLAKLHDSRLYSVCKEKFQIECLPELESYWQICRSD